MKRKNLIINLFVLLFIAFVFVSEVKVKAEPESELSLVSDAKSAVLLEPKTLKVIYAKDEKKALKPASMTKIMTMILTMEALKNNVITLDQTLYASEYATSMGGTQIYLEPNEGMIVEDLLKSVAIASANDAAVVLAEAIGGSTENFVLMMNNKAKEIGAVNTNFMNPNGLNQDNHYSCSYDMAIFGAYLVNNYPEITKYTSIYEDYVREDTAKKFWLVNTNKLIKTNPDIDGIKTGWTEEAGYCLTTTIKFNGERFIATTMGNSTPTLRNKEVMQMLNYATSTYEIITLYKKGDIIATYNDINMSPKIFNIFLTEDIILLKKKGEQLGEITTDKVIDYSNIKDVGVFRVYYENELLKEVKLSIQEEVVKASFLEVFFEVIKEIFLVTN